MQNNTLKKVPMASSLKKVPKSPVGGPLAEFFNVTTANALAMAELVKRQKAFDAKVEKLAHAVAMLAEATKVLSAATAHVAKAAPSSTASMGGTVDLEETLRRVEAMLGQNAPKNPTAAPRRTDVPQPIPGTAPALTPTPNPVPSVAPKATGGFDPLAFYGGGRPNR